MRRPVALLPKVLTDQIAAGEVVEGPFSVVKELIENALDAEALEISIHLKGGGCEEIIVQDNGFGMSAQDLELCILRHATSKIQTFKDLMKLRSHGFRGEALAAIAAVSRLKIVAGIDDDPTRSCVLEVDPLRKQKLSAAPYRKGTSVQVQHLFSWIPARKKFLRSASVESSRCVKALWPLMLMNPSVCFKLSADESRSDFVLPAVVDNKERFFQIFPMLSVKDVFQISTLGHDMEVSGFLSNPMATVGHRRYLFLGVNHRVVELPSILGVLKRVFSTVDGKRGLPWGFLHFRVPSAEVDFNVDPKKESVRFLREDRVIALLQTELNRLVDRGNVVLPSSQRMQWMSSMTPLTASPLRFDVSGSRGELIPITHSSSPEVVMAGPPSGIETELIPWKTLRVLGIAADQLIICAMDDGAFYYFDQHALHERITYEQYRVQWLKGEIQIQNFLIPEKRSVDEELWRKLVQFQDVLRMVGFVLKCEDNGTVVLEGVPIFFNHTPTFDNLLTWAAYAPGSFSVEVQSDREGFIADMACKHSVRRGDPLSQAEILSLFQLADEWIQDRRTCPHGRPFVLKIPYSDICKTFYRNGKR